MAVIVTAPVRENLTPRDINVRIYCSFFIVFLTPRPRLFPPSPGFQRCGGTPVRVRPPQDWPEGGTHRGRRLRHHPAEQAAPQLGHHHGPRLRLRLLRVQDPGEVRGGHCGGGGGFNTDKNFVLRCFLRENLFCVF